MRKTKTWLIGITLAGMLAMLLAPAWALEIDFTTEANPNYGPFIDFTYRPSNLTSGASGLSPNGPFSVTFGTYSSWCNLYANPGGGITLRDSSGNVVPTTFSQAFLDQIHTDGEPDPSAGTRLDRCTLTPTSALAAGANYYYSISAGMSIAYSDGSHHSLLPLDPRNSPYYNAANNDFEIPFTTANAFIGSSWNINGGATTNVTQAQTNVSINAVIRVVMSNALNGSTVNDTNVVLHEGGASGAAVTTTVALDTNDTTNKTVLVTPSAPLKYSTSYALILTNVADTGGQLLP